jgi:N-methylhydantoinase A
MDINNMRIGIDIGGTFTDFVVFDQNTGVLRTHKRLSTPHDPSEAVLAGLAFLLGKSTVSQDDSGGQAISIVHGSTVATNALLERKGAPTGLVTTLGFRDVLVIGRQNRPALYDLFADPLPSLVPTELRFEVDERVDHNGKILTALNSDSVDDLIKKITTSNVKSIAVSLLFSFLRPEHELQIKEKLLQAGFLVSISSDIIPVYREYERTSTTVVNAYVSPVLDSYLANLEKGIGQTTGLRIMQSNGGSISASEARHQAVRCILSGPAGGIMGCKHVAKTAFSLPHEHLDSPSSPQVDEITPIKIITFDMGGTSTDVSLIDGEPKISTETIISGCPIQIPMLDIHTIGAGGGSIAYPDAGGALRVGPESAGAEPGPACYGRGDLPTVTDANVLLGRLPPDHFLGGQMTLDVGRARDVLERLGSELNLSATQTALGMVAITNAHMERALRVISVERGHDPREFTLLSFGGAGGLHAADLARSLGIPRILIPPQASTLSAFGMLVADVVKDYTLTVMMLGDTPIDELASRLDELARRGIQEIRNEGVPEGAIYTKQFLDMRYSGQSYELIVPFTDKVLDDFHQLHLLEYGYANSDGSVQIVNLRVQAIGKVDPPDLPRLIQSDSDPGKAWLENRTVVFPSGKKTVPLYQAELLHPGNQIPGPAIVIRSDTTILMGVTDKGLIDSTGNLLIEVGR